MERFKLTYYQILGLATISVGSIINYLVYDTIAMIIASIGLLVFLLGSRLNAGIKLSLIILIIGGLFRIMHWPLGSILLLTGMLGISSSFFYKYVIKTHIREMIFLYISSIIIIVGIFFHISHFPYNTELLIAGFSALSISYTYRFIRKINKTFEDYNKLLLVYAYSLAYLFNTLYWPLSIFVGVVYILTLWTWLIYSYIRY